MQTLDRLLYAWLGEHDDTRFQRAFSTYFRAAFPAIVRYLSRRNVFDQFQLEDLAQETLLKFFDRIGSRRRNAFATTAQSLPQITPLNLGVFHERQVTNWKRGVGGYATDAMNFAARARELTATTDWKSIVREISGRAPGLHEQGCHLLGAVRSDTEGHSAAEAESSHPGLKAFMSATSVVTEAVPELRVPTNGFLFEIALSLYLDKCKHQSRKKRGGAGVSCDLSSLESPHPLDVDESQPMPDDSIDEERRAQAHGELAPVANSSAWCADPNLIYENQQFLEKFYDYLRRPVEAAHTALAQAATAASAESARRRLESVTQKFARLSAILALLGEGFAQEAIAERLGLSRNQVKYVVECVQESYLQFCGRTMQPAQPTAVAEEPTHVK